MVQNVAKEATICLTADHVVPLRTPGAMKVFSAGCFACRARPCPHEPDNNGTPMIPDDQIALNHPYRSSTTGKLF